MNVVATPETDIALAINGDRGKVAEDVGRRTASVDGVLTDVEDLFVEGHFDEIFLALNHDFVQAGRFGTQLNFSQIHFPPSRLQTYGAKHPRRIPYKVDNSVIVAGRGLKRKHTGLVGDAAGYQHAVGRVVKAYRSIG